MGSHVLFPRPRTNRDWMLMYLGFLLGEKLHDSISVEFAVVSIRVTNSRRAIGSDDFAPLRLLVPSLRGKLLKAYLFDILHFYV